MAVLIGQKLNLDNDREYKITNTLLLDSLLKENLEERKAVGKAVGSGFKPIASIPIPVLEADPDGNLFLQCNSGSPEARVALDRFLKKPGNDRYRTSTVRL